MKCPHRVLDARHREVPRRAASKNIGPRPEAGMRQRHPERNRIAASALLALLGFGWLGCGDPEGPIAPPSPGLQGCGAANVLVRSHFPNSSTVDNRWYPLIPGTEFVLDGVANRGGGILPHRVVFTVTDLVKVVGGVEAVVLWDRDYNNGVLQEAELAFHAQDDEGNVWVVGEYPEEYEHGEFVGAPSTWIAGLAGAEAGILVPGTPRIGFKYLQGWAPDINFLDCGTVFSLGETACVPFNCYESVLVIDEESPIEVGSGHQRKHYAPGVGVVRVGAVDDPEGETLVLVNLVHLGERELAEANAEALALERRAYEINADYRFTAPAHPRP